MLLAVLDSHKLKASSGDNTPHERPGADDQGDYRNTTLKGKLDWFLWKPVVDYFFDSDGDGVEDTTDNCQFIANEDQTDFDSDDTHVLDSQYSAC